MAELTVAVDVYEENVPKVCHCGRPMLAAGSACACPSCGMTGVRLLFDAVWVRLDAKHTWMLVLGMSGRPWLGPYWEDEAFEAAARG